jgi:hypothetical protein
MKAINTLEAAKNLITAIKADAKAGVSIESLVKLLHAEATKAGHEEADITTFIKEKMAEVYGTQTALFNIRWGAARVALCKVRKANGTSPKEKIPPFIASTALTKRFIRFLAENNISDEDMKRAANALAANIVLK